MRTLLKINFLILAMAAFFIVYRQAFMQRYDKFYYEEGKIILDGNSTIEKYQNNPNLFFYEAKGLHQKTPIYTYSNLDIKIDIYEISFPDHSKKSIHNVVTYLMPIISADESVFANKDLMYGIYFVGEDDELEENVDEKLVYWFEIVDFVNLGIYFADTGYGEIIPVIAGEEKDLLPVNPIRIEIFTASEIKEDGIDKIKIDRLLVAPFTIDENSFLIRNKLIELFHEKESAGKKLNITDEDIEILESEEIYFTVFHNASKYNSVLYLWFGSYLGIVLVFGYFVFYYKRDGGKHLGRQKPTKALKESIKETEIEN